MKIFRCVCKNIIGVLLVTTFTYCTKDTSPAVTPASSTLATPTSSTPLTMDNPVVYNTWNSVLSNGSDKTYDIGVVFEEQGEQKPQSYYDGLIDRMIGGGDFSLFKTKPFDENKNKFNVSYAVITRSKDKNTGLADEELKDFRTKAREYFLANKQAYVSAEGLSELSMFIQNMTVAIGLTQDIIANTSFYKELTTF